MSGRRKAARGGAYLSQHFLRNERLARRLVALSSISGGDLVIEAGPGRGALTRVLAEKARRVVSVEYDRALADDLRKKFSGNADIYIHTGDFLQFSLPHTPYKFFSNIPFARTADIVRKLAFSGRQPEDAYLIVQSQAATRFLGQPFGPESATSLLIKAQFDASILAWLNPADFDPPPSVNSVLLRLNRLSPPRVSPEDLRDFGTFARSVMRAGNRRVTSQLRYLFTPHQARGLINDLNFPSLAPPSAISFEHWLTVFRLHRWSRSDS